MTQPLFSIVVCTYNRADLLPACLGSLVDQILDKSLYRVIVVNNNSTDSTADVVNMFIKSQPNFSMVIETRQGIANARNRGWQTAQSLYVGYIDDDCKSPTHWLALAHEIVATRAPVVFGGSSFAYYMSPKPAWYKDSYIDHDFGKDSRPLNDNEYFESMNMFIRRSVFEKVGGFDAELGMRGKKIAYGEETVFLQRVRETMPQELIYYHPDLYVYHTVRPERMKIGWLARSSFSGGCYSYRVFRNHTLLSPFNLFKNFLRAAYYFLLDLLRAFFARDRAQYPYAQNYLYERAFQHLRSLGELYEQYAQLSKR
jgi:glycosyltransferase involved in cell wall biosynthesis